MGHNFLQTSPSDLQKVLEEEKQHIREMEISKQAAVTSQAYINLHGFPVDLNVLSLFSEAEARQLRAVPFYREHHDVRVGAVDVDAPLLREKLKHLSAKYNVTLYVISPASLDYVLPLYKKVAVARPDIGDDSIKITKPLPPAEILTRLKLEKVQEATSTTQILSDIFAAALQLSASDIHLEPEEHFIKLRYRLDGVLQDVGHLSKKIQRALTSRIKILSKLKLNIESLPQDGRLTLHIDGKPVDVRVAVLPSAYGEGVVLRLLGVGAVNLKVNDLGLRGKAYEIIEQVLGQPNGMIITTGPTGSGKTTTLYAFLNELNQPGVKIITLEDPVEYKLEGIQQTPIDHNVDFNFAKGLRAVLRQDPDIIMVGEIRDGETADTALQASLTGHLVLSTLHTNDAAGAVPRLITMGAKPFVIAPALNAVIAQRLVRRLCETCKEPAQLPGPVRKHVEEILQTISMAAKVKLPAKLEFYHSPGCSECHNLGYRGRIGVYEVMAITDAIKELIQKEASGVQLKKQAVADGMVTMTQDGLLKALEGITDVDEVFRVTGE